VTSCFPRSLRTDALISLPCSLLPCCPSSRTHIQYHLSQSKPATKPFTPQPSYNPSAKPRPSTLHSRPRLPSLAAYKTCRSSLEEANQYQETSKPPQLRAGLKQPISIPQPPTHPNLVSHYNTSHAGRRKGQHLYSNYPLSTTLTTSSNHIITTSGLHLAQQPINATNSTTHHHQQPLPHRSNGSHKREPRRLWRLLQRHRRPAQVQPNATPQAQARHPPGQQAHAKGRRLDQSDEIERLPLMDVGRPSCGRQSRTSPIHQLHLETKPKDRLHTTKKKG